MYHSGLGQEMLPQWGYLWVEAFSSFQFSSVAKSCPTLWDPMDCSMPGLPVLHQLSEFDQTHVHWVGDAIQPSHPLLPLILLPSVFPSIRIFSNESALLIRWPKYWSCSFSIRSIINSFYFLLIKTILFYFLTVYIVLHSLLIAFNFCL